MTELPYYATQTEIEATSRQLLATALRTKKVQRWRETGVRGDYSRQVGLYLFIVGLLSRNDHPLPGPPRAAS